MIWLAVACVLVSGAATDQRINLADFARVVKFAGDTPATLETHELESGADGWPVWTGEDGQSMIGLEWDSPRDLAEVEIEFRHAIADREQIRVQYFLPHMPATQPADASRPVDPFHGQWVTAKADWWAGDRYVGFAFAPLNEELRAVGVPADTYRRTYRLRFLLGKRKQELPAVRYLRAYGPGKPIEANFVVRLDRMSPLQMPLRVKVVNGLVVTQDGETMRSTTLESTPARLRVRFAEQDARSASRTIVTLTDGRNEQRGFSFLPAEVVGKGIVPVPALGVVVVHAGGDKDLTTRAKTEAPVFDRIGSEPTPTFERTRQAILGARGSPGSFMTPDQRQEQRYQRVLQGAMTIEVPEPLLNEFFRTQICRLIAAADREVPNSEAPRSVEAFAETARPVPSCQQVRALDLVGLSPISRVTLEACLQVEPPLKLAGRFGAKQNGVLGLPGPDGGERFGRSSLGQGVRLGLLGEHYLLCRDRRWLAKRAIQLAEACDLVIQQCKAPEEANTLSKEDQYWGVGLLPPGPIEGSGAWLWWLSANAYAVRGLRLTTEALADVNDPAAPRLAKQTSEFEEHLRRSCREAMLRSPVVRLADGQYVPFQPICSRLRGRAESRLLEAIHSPVHLIGCGLYAADSPEAEWILRDTEDNVLPAVGMGMPDRPASALERAGFLSACAASPAGPPPLTPVYLQRGLYRHALRDFYDFLAAGSVADARSENQPAAASGPAKEAALASSGVGPALLVWFRHLLIWERGRELNLLAGVPAGWLEKGRRIAVRQAPTWFGPMDMTVESAADANRIVVRMSGPSRQPPEAVRLWVRPPRPLLAVTCNGQRLADFDPASGLIRLSGNLQQAEVVITY